MTDTIGKLSPKAAEAKIREIAKLGTVTLGTHCTKRMRERSIDTQDLRNILDTCVVTGPPEYDQTHQQWKYKARGFVIDGDRAVAITIIVNHRELFIVTVY